MQVVSKGPLEVASIVWLPRPGAYTLTLACKATFDLAPDESPIAAQRQAAIERDVYFDDDEEKSLLQSTDLVPVKRPEILLTGHAYAPGGEPVTALVAKIAVGRHEKSITVIGDQLAATDGTLSVPASFSKMQLQWERAAGGPDTSNPVGVRTGRGAQRDAWGRVQLPNLRPRGHVVTSPDDVVPPACFAPLSPSWPSRLAHLGEHASTWSVDTWQARTIPSDIDMSYFNAAPADQIVGELSGTEVIALENLHPLYPLLRTRLARIVPRARVDWGAGNINDLALVCDTLTIDTDRAIATLTYRGHIGLDTPDRPGWILIDCERLPTAPVSVAPPPAVGSVPPPATTAPQTAPIRQSPANIGEVQPQVVVQAVPAWIDEVKELHETVSEADEPAAPALPFSPSGPNAMTNSTIGDHDGAVSEAPVSEGPVTEDTIDRPTAIPKPFAHRPTSRTLPGTTNLSAAMPFQPVASQFDSPAPPPPAAGLPFAHAVSPHTAQLPVNPIRSPAPPARPVAPVLGEGRTIGELAARRHFIPNAPRPALPPPESSTAEIQLPQRSLEVPEPPRLGPTATTDSAPPKPASIPPEKPAPKPEPEAPETKEEEMGPFEPPLRLDYFTLDKCARIAASIARRPEKIAKILEDHTLDERTWTRHRDHYAAAMKAEQLRGKTALLRVYDHAYVSQLEDERGPIKIDEYAQLVVAAERGTANVVSESLDLPAGALMRIQRHWIQKMGGDAALRKQVNAAVEAAADA